MICLTAPRRMTRCSTKAGNVWFSDFQHQFISKLDPKSGKVTRYPVPDLKAGLSDRAV
jgi:streptogramin lyase